MSKTIVGVPESITREDYTNLIRSIGIEPTQTMDLVFGATSITATVFATGPDGESRVLGPDGYDRHSIVIPITD